MKIELITDYEVGEWQQLKIDGKIVAENHTIDPRLLLRVLKGHGAFGDNAVEIRDEVIEQ